MLHYTGQLQRSFEGTVVKQSEMILAASRATDEFKQAVRDLRQGLKSPLIAHQDNHPAVKVFRVVLKLLDARPGLPVIRTEISGESGCADFQGTVICYAPDPITFNFIWDCAWKARREKYYTVYGGLDQVRAAIEFGYDCFKLFAEEDRSAAQR